MMHDILPNLMCIVWYIQYHKLQDKIERTRMAQTRIRSKQARLQHAYRKREAKTVARRWANRPARVLVPGTYYKTNQVPEYGMCRSCQTPRDLHAIEAADGWHLFVKNKGAHHMMCWDCFLSYRNRPGYELRVMEYGYGMEYEDLGTVDQVYFGAF